MIWGLKTDYTNISPSRYLWVTILAVFVAELLIMFLVDFIDFGNVWVTALFDSMVLSLALFVINYRLMARPLIFHKKALEDHVQELLEARQELEASNLHLSELAHDLEEQREKAEAASMAKSQFLSIMSHELRTPLNTIIGFSEVLLEGLEGPLSPGQREDLRIIRESGDHLLSLVNDILELSAFHAGQVHADFVEVDAVEIALAPWGSSSAAYGVGWARRSRWSRCSIPCSRPWTASWAVRSSAA